MKKILATLLAVVMLFAMCANVLAEEKELGPILQDIKNTGKIVVAGTGDDFLKGDVLTSVYLGGKKE